MTAKKVSELDALTIPTSGDLLLIVDDPSVDPVSKKITVGNLHANISSNNIVSNNVSANVLSAGLGAANTTLTSSSIKVNSATQNVEITATLISIGNSSVNSTVTGSLVTTPSLLLSNTTNNPANNATGTAGEIRVTNSAIYVCVATNSWKRVNLSDYS